MGVNYETKMWGGKSHHMLHVLLAVVAERGAREVEALLPGDLGDAPLGCEVAVEDLQVPGRLDRRGERDDDLLAVFQVVALYILMPSTKRKVEAPY